MQSVRTSPVALTADQWAAIMAAPDVALAGRRLREVWALLARPADRPGHAADETADQPHFA